MDTKTDVLSILKKKNGKRGGGKVLKKEISTSSLRRKMFSLSRKSEF